MVNKLPSSPGARKWNGCGPTREPVLPPPAPSGLETEMRTLFADVLTVEEEVVELSSMLDDLEADSLDRAELCFQIEEQLGIVIPEDRDIWELWTFGDWLALVASLGKPKRTRKRA